MVQNSSRKDDVILKGRQIDGAKVTLKSSDCSRIDCRNQGMRSLEHGLAQIDKITGKGRSILQKLERVVAGTAADIKNLSYSGTA